MSHDERRHDSVSRLLARFEEKGASSGPPSPGLLTPSPTASGFVVPRRSSASRPSSTLSIPRSVSARASPAPSAPVSPTPSLHRATSVDDALLPKNLDAEPKETGSAPETDIAPSKDLVVVTHIEPILIPAKLVESPVPSELETLEPPLSPNMAASELDIHRPLISEDISVDPITDVVPRAQDGEQTVTSASLSLATEPSLPPNMANPGSWTNEETTHSVASRMEDGPTIVIADLVDEPHTSSTEPTHPVESVSTAKALPTGAPVAPPIAVSAPMEPVVVPLASEPIGELIGESSAAFSEPPTHEATDALALSLVVDAEAPEPVTILSPPHVEDLVAEPTAEAVGTDDVPHAQASETSVPLPTETVPALIQTTKTEMEPKPVDGAALNQLPALVVERDRPAELDQQPAATPTIETSQPAAPAPAPVLDPAVNTTQPSSTAPAKAPLVHATEGPNETALAPMPIWAQFARNSTLFADSPAPDLRLSNSSVATPPPSSPSAPVAPSDPGTRVVAPSAAASPAPRPAHARKASLDARRAAEARRAQEGRRRGANPFAALGKLFRFGKGRKRKLTT